MGARGPHDGLDAARAVVAAGLEAMNSGDVEAAMACVAEDLEHVTRDGVVRGPARLNGELSTQLQRWKIDYELEELVDAGDGALVALLEVERRDRESDRLDWKAWPAIVLRVKDDRVVFLEGYVDRRKALDDLGVSGR